MLQPHAKFGALPSMKTKLENQLGIYYPVTLKKLFIILTCLTAPYPYQSRLAATSINMEFVLGIFNQIGNSEDFSFCIPHSFSSNVATLFLCSKNAFNTDIFQAASDNASCVFGLFFTFVGNT